MTDGLFLQVEDDGCRSSIRSTSTPVTKNHGPSRLGYGRKGIAQVCSNGGGTALLVGCCRMFTIDPPTKQ